VPAPQESESRGGSADRSQTGTQPPREVPGVWLPFGLFVLGFVILVTESKYTLPIAADYALKGLGGGLCFVTVVWIRRQARKFGLSRRVNKND
jgi:hypothetical protein